MSTQITITRNVFCSFLPKNIARFEAVGNYNDLGDFIGSIYFAGSDTAIGVTTNTGFQLESAIFPIEKLNTDLSILIEKVFLPDQVMRVKADLKAKRDRMIQEQASESFLRFMTETDRASNATKRANKVANKNKVATTETLVQADIVA